MFVASSMGMTCYSLCRTKQYEVIYCKHCHDYSTSKSSLYVTSYYDNSNMPLSATIHHAFPWDFHPYPYPYPIDHPEVISNIIR